MWYRLTEDRIAVPCSLDEWIAWRRTQGDQGDRPPRVNWTSTPYGDVSTVFLSIDHGHGLGGPPVLYETMIFGGPEDTVDFQRRYTDWDQAAAGHDATVAMLLARDAQPAQRDTADDSTSDS